MGFTLRQCLLITTSCISIVLVSSIFSLQAPFFPKEAEKKNVSPTEYGLVFGIYDGTVLFASLLISSTISYIGRKFCFIAGNVVAGVCTILFGMLEFCSRQSFLAFAFILRIVEGFAQSAGLCAVMVIFVTEFGNNVEMMISLQEACFGIGLFLGPLTGGLLYDLGGFYLPFVIVGCLILLSTTLTYICVPPSRTYCTTLNAWLAFKTLAVPGIWVGILSTGLGSFCYGFLQTTFEPHLRPFNLTGTKIGLIFFLMFSVYCVFCPIWAKLAKMGLHPRIIMIIGSLLMAIGFACIGPLPGISTSEPHLWYILVGVILNGAAQGAVFLPGLLDIRKVLEKKGYEVDETSQGVSAGLWQSAFSLGGCIGPAIGGALYQHLGFRNSSVIFVALNIIFVLWISILCIFNWRRGKFSCIVPRKKSRFQLLLEEEENSPLIPRLHNTIPAPKTKVIRWDSSLPDDRICERLIALSP